MSSTNRGSVRDTLDRYYTPDALAKALVGVLPMIPDDAALEPHVGGGAFARAMRARGVRVHGLDLDIEAAGIDDCNSSETGIDFLAWTGRRQRDWIIGNPPYGDAEAHIRHALDITGRHVAFLLRLAMLETAGRIPLWRDHPPRMVWVLSQRPSFTGGSTDSCAYGWFWWDKRHVGDTGLGWVSWKGQK